ncbi:hypothetical protein DF3PB_3420002 [uncultured Defluviicoccus sp.]|uniref:Uncharacterized protein n=1 Tax=metagenome TaxID=256318 RepID=A0A380TF19_9ZZZZ|nr:hypothetical protein DF3PB_3420002 [uncultured Defluviicoccus sp.]
MTARGGTPARLPTWLYHQAAGAAAHQILAQSARALLAFDRAGTQAVEYATVGHLDASTLRLERAQESRVLRLQAAPFGIDLVRRGEGA